MLDTFSLAPIGLVRSTRTEPSDDAWDTEEAAIELAQELPEEALVGLADFSHVEVFYIFHRVAPDATVRGARHPRGNTAWPRVGIFAQRGKDRPSRLGATICRVLSIEGRRLRVAGLDAIDGSPVIDLKPWMREFGPRGEVFQPAWATELMRGYWE